MNTERSFHWKCMQGAARFLTTLAFDLKVDGLHNMPPALGGRARPARAGGVLIVSNHQGNLDPVLLAVRLKRPLNYIAKSELFENRWADFLLRAVNAFPVRQGAGDVHAVKETIHRLQAGHLLNIYPEGGRTTNGEIGQLQRGVGLIIRRAGVPVIPAVICGSYEAWPIQRTLFRPWPIRVRFGPPMHFDGMGADQIIASVDRTLRGMFEDLRKRQGSVTISHPPAPPRARHTNPSHSKHRNSSRTPPQAADRTTA
jgi:1-acyl-sn-glycerol-3-phosphate acyltransferase